MKTYSLFLVILLLSAAAAVADTYVVSIDANGLFDPDFLEIQPGDKVRWENNDNEPHRVKADNGSFDSGRLDPGDSYTRTFNDPGAITYYDTFKPATTGTIIVHDTAVLPTSWGLLLFLFR